MSARQHLADGPTAMPRPWVGEWDVLRSPIIGETPAGRVRVDILAAHPTRGVALIDIAPGFTPKAVATFRCRLEIADFAARHPGTLPLAYCRLDAADLPRLPRLLDEALPVQPARPAAGNWVPSLAALVQPAADAVPKGRRRAPMLLAGAAVLALALIGLSLFPGAAEPPRMRTGMVAPVPAIVPAPGR